MILHALLDSLVFLFPVSEIALAIVKRARRAAVATVEDRGSMGLLWLTISASVALAIVCSGVRATHLPIPATWREATALGLLVGGLLLRWSAILILGRFFTVHVAIHGDHRLVEIGPYRTIRHPAYSGLLLAFLGLGVFFGNGLSVVALMIPITLAVAYRIRVEESALRRALGAGYSAYCARTKRLIPGVL